MKALVTGGAGFIGSNLVEELVKRNAAVRVVDNLITGKMENLEGLCSSIRFVEGDLCDLDTAAKAVSGVDVVFHVAALPCAPVSMERPEDTVRHNVVATVNVLKAAVQSDVRRVVYSSSSSIYGGEGPFPQKEDTPPKPKHPYAAAKLSCEVFVRTFAHAFGLDAVSLRYFNVFGPKQPVRSQYSAVFPAFISRMLRGERPVIYGDGHQSRDFTHVSNVVRANLLAAERECPFVGEAINVAAGRSISLIEIVAYLNRIIDADLEPMHEAERPGDVRDSLADLTRARELLGYEPEVRVDEGLQQTVEYFKGLVKRQADGTVGEQGRSI